MNLCCLWGALTAPHQLSHSTPSVSQARKSKTNQLTELPINQLQTNAPPPRQSLWSSRITHIFITLRTVMKKILSEQQEAS